MLSARPYRALLARPFVARLVLLALAGRIPVASQSLALLLLVHHATGSYATAGAVAAAYGLAVGCFAPLHGRLIDALGQTRVLCVAAVGNALMLALVIVLAAAHAPAGLLMAAAALAGALM